VFAVSCGESIGPWLFRQVGVALLREQDSAGRAKSRLEERAQGLKPRVELREELRLLIRVELVKIPLARYPAGKEFKELRPDAAQGLASWTRSLIARLKSWLSRS